jgi:hypothetical protein
LVASDFPSVAYPWLAARDRLGMRICWVRDTAARDLTLALGDATSERTTVVCVGAVQFATGSQVDVAALVARARDVGARVVVDVTQMAGAVPVAMTAWEVHALVCRSYKWLSAPAGVALLALTEKLAAATPVIVGWKGSAVPFDFTSQELSLAADARRFELSTMSYSAAAGLLTSIRLLTGVGLTAISEHASAPGGRSGRAGRAAGMDALPGARGPFGKRAHRLAQAPRRRGRPGTGRTRQPAHHQHQLLRRRYPGIPARRRSHAPREKRGITAGQRGGLDKVGSRSLPKPEGGQDVQPKLVAK